MLPGRLGLDGGRISGVEAEGCVAEPFAGGVAGAGIVDGGTQGELGGGRVAGAVVEGTVACAGSAWEAGCWLTTLLPELVRPVGDNTAFVCPRLFAVGVISVFEPPWAKFVPPPRFLLVPCAKFVWSNEPFVS